MGWLQWRARMDADDTLVQYVLVRKDLKWPQGAVIAQACHATTAVNWSTRDDADTRAYLDAADAMHKVVLGADGEAALVACAEQLTAAGVAHKLWIEMPERVPTCLATKPCPRRAVKALMASFKLLR